EYQHNREERTWQYLFKVIYDPEDENEERREFLLSIYDYQTDISTGLSAWRQPEGDVEQVLTPVEDVEELDAEELQENRIPDEEFLEGVVQLVLNMIEEPVPATFKDRWI
ncbi:MAG: hypothetical protein SV377_06745, partial [Halobacteria archaeon]|nr:hypothetical protein [Halobacteria archaeon]